MDAKILLFAEICSAAGAQTTAQRKAVWSCLSHYIVQDTAAASSWTDSVAAFVAAKQVDGLSPRTIKEYRRVLTAAGATLGVPVPAHVTTDQLRAYLSALDSDHKPSSVNTYAAILRSFFGWLHSEEQLSRNPMSKIRPRRLDRKGTRKPLTARELERVRRFCRTPRESAVVELLAATGCRVSELCGIRREDIDTAARTITVTGKGNKTRSVLYSPRAEAALETHLLTALDGPLFPGVRSIQRMLHRLGMAAGLSTPLYPHKFRHTFATLALNRGMDLPSLQMLLGHSSPATTEIYAKLSPRTVSRAYARAVA